MASPPASLIHENLESALRLVVASAPTMTVDEILMVRIRLTEADIIMGQLLVERDAAAAAAAAATTTTGK